MLKYVLLSILIALICACSDEPGKPETEFDPSVVSVRLDEVWNINSAVEKIVEVKVDDPQGFRDVRNIYFRILDAGSVSVYDDSLYDDGGLSGTNDVIAGDGVFRTKILPVAVTNQVGFYTFEFDVLDKEGNSAGELKRDVEFIFSVVNNIDNIIAPDTLKSGSEPVSITAKVSSMQGESEVEKVFMDLRRNNVSVLSAPIEMNKTGQDSIFAYTIDSTFAAARKGTYILQFYAQSSTGDKSDTFDHEIFIENNKGRIISVNVPATIKRPASGFNTALVTAKVSDPQGLADIDSVYFNSQKPDGNPAAGNPFVLVDNGLPFNVSNPFIEAGDQVAGDGIYSITIFVDNSNQLGTYTFTFHLSDKTGNKGVSGQGSIEVQL